MIRTLTAIGEKLAGKPYAVRSAKWRKVRADFLVLFPSCTACGTKTNLNVHHIRPFHLYPELELEPANLITLCEQHNCHYLFGHFLDWKAFNPKVVTQATSYFRGMNARPYK